METFLKFLATFFCISLLVVLCGFFSLFGSVGVFLIILSLISCMILNHKAHKMIEAECKQQNNNPVSTQPMNCSPIGNSKLIDSPTRVINGQKASDKQYANPSCDSREENQENLRKILNSLVSLQKQTKSNLTAIPYMAQIIADFDTRELDIFAQQLNWGSDQKRLKKVKSILEIKKETKELLAQYKIYQYQLEYAIRMFPALEDFLETDYHSLPSVQLSDISSENHDNVRNYLTKEEYSSLSTSDRNQLALDRYWESRRKSNWQIGRDYELYVGYKYEAKGYTVDYYGSVHKLEDLGRDLIAKKDGRTLIIQCKYWSAKKQIHEKHINQLYGTMVCYCFENNLPRDAVHGVLVTNITLSDTARQFAKYLEIEIAENFPLGNYPCIKCNINRSATDENRKIYHLPFDQQYDSCQINSPGEFMAMTVAEAEAAGFRRAYRWHGQNN